MHKEFWFLLREDTNTSLRRLNIVGSGISQRVFKAKNHFSRMIKLNPLCFQPYKVKQIHIIEGF